MKKNMAIIGLAFLLSTGSAFAAETKTANENVETGMMVAGSVNDIVITVAEANNALKMLTKGKMTWEKLPQAGKQQLIEMMAPSKLVAAASKKDLTEKEKEAALAGFWMQKKISQTEVSDKEAQAAYDKMKKKAKKAKSKKKIPEFETVKNSIKMQLAQEKVVGELMKSATIKLK